MPDNIISIPRLNELLAVLSFTKYRDDEKIRKFMKAAFLSEDRETVADLSEYLSMHALDAIIAEDPFYPYPAKEDLAGEIKIGHVLQTGEPVYLRLDSLNRNLLITGAHGTGKTNLINVIIRGLLGK